MKSTLFPCQICGEQKEWKDFHNICFFSTYKKRRVQWCRDCQKMYVSMRKEQEQKEQTEKRKINYLVTF